MEKQHGTIAVFRMVSLGRGDTPPRYELVTWTDDMEEAMKTENLDLTNDWVVEVKA